MTAEDEDRAIAHVIDRLAGKFPDLPRSNIERAVHERRAALAENPVRDYIPVLIEHEAKELLRESAPT